MAVENLPNKVKLNPKYLADARAKIGPAPVRKPMDFSALDRTKTTPTGDPSGAKRKALLDALKG